MKNMPTLWLIALLVMNIGCSRVDQKVAQDRSAKGSEPATTSSAQPIAKVTKEKVTKEVAIATAKDDYRRRNSSLKRVDFDVSDEPDGWHVSYYPHVRDGTIAGGGGVYLIDKETGEILDLKLYQ